MFQKTAKSKLNGFEYKFIPRTVDTLLMIGLMILIFLASMLATAFIDKYVFPHVTKNMFYVFVLAVIILFIYAQIKFPRDRHGPCRRALKKLQGWKETWQKAGLDESDADMQSLEAKIKYLKAHSEAPLLDPDYCEVRKDFYSGANNLIRKINLKVFDRMPY